MVRSICTEHNHDISQVRTIKMITSYSGPCTQLISKAEVTRMLVTYVGVGGWGWVGWGGGSDDNIHIKADQTKREFP